MVPAKAKVGSVKGAHMWPVSMSFYVVVEQFVSPPISRVSFLVTRMEVGSGSNRVIVVFLFPSVAVYQFAPPRIDPLLAKAKWVASMKVSVV